MGCANHKGVRIMPRKTGNEKSRAFILKIEDPKTYQVINFTYETENDELPIMQIMNAIAFEESEKGAKFDGNFIALLNDERKEFEYYV